MLDFRQSNYEKFFIISLSEDADRKNILSAELNIITKKYK